MEVDPKNLQPNLGKVFVLPEALDEKTAGGLYVPGTAEQSTVKLGSCVTGAEARRVNGEDVSIRVNEGDRVVFDSLGAPKLKYKGKEYLLIRLEDIIGRVVPDSSAIPF